MKNFSLVGIIGIVWLSLSTHVFAQDWAPIRFSDKTYAFQLGQEAELLYIRAEEANVADADSVYHLNTRITDCDTCGWREFLRNQPHFLQKRVRFNDAGWYHFQDTGSFVILAQAGVGESWVYDSLANITATVQAIEWVSVFDQSDSVKTISLSSGEIIKLSRQFGILEFPASNGESYQVQGIQGPKLGIPLYEYQDFFDYDVGDQF